MVYLPRHFYLKGNDASGENGGEAGGLGATHRCKPEPKPVGRGPSARSLASFTAKQSFCQTCERGQVYPNGGSAVAL